MPRPRKCRRLCDVMFIRRCGCHCRHIPCASIYSDMRFHAEPPFIPFLGLVHFGISCFVFVLCRTGRVDDRRIQNRSAVHDAAVCFQDSVDCRKHGFAEIDPSACYMRLCALEGAIQGVRWHHLDEGTKKEMKAFYTLSKKL